MAEVKVKQLDTFLWKGINKRGKTSHGEIRASSIADAKALLRQQGFTPSSVKKKANPLAFTQPGIKSSDISVVTRQIATMLGAGVPLVQSIDLIASGASNDTLRQLMTKVSAEGTRRYSFV